MAIAGFFQSGERAIYASPRWRGFTLGFAGQVGAYLRKQGLYSGTVSRWRWESESTTMGSVAHRKPGPKPQKTAEEAEIARLQRRIAALEDKLEVAHEIIAVQKKISEIFSGLSPKTPNDNSDTG